MIILDTNVLSALMVHPADTRVVHWLDQIDPDTVWITTITVFEVQFGLDILVQSKRKKTLQERFENLLVTQLENRILPFDTAAAQRTAALSAQRKKHGIVVDFRDSVIAGITISKQATLATRNVKHFDDLEIELINPWDKSLYA